MSAKNDLKSLGEQYTTLTPKDVFMSLYPAIERVVQMPMNGKIAFSFSRNHKNIVNLANRINKRRQEKLLGDDMVELDDAGNVKFEKVEGKMEEQPVFKSRILEAEFNKWDAEFMENAVYELRVVKVHVDDLMNIPSIPPMLVTMLSALIYDPNADENAPSYKEAEPEPATA